MGSKIPYPHTKKEKKQNTKWKQGDTDGQPIGLRGFGCSGLTITYLRQAAVMEKQAASGECIRPRQKKKELLLCLGVTLWHTSLKCERDGNAVWRLECRSRCPSVGRSDSRVPTPGRCTWRDRRVGGCEEQVPAGACETQSLAGSSGSATSTAQE